ncbi:MAG: ABC transporter ATP-binding protein [Thermaceae bacterium]|nr:ABC transporter ATP-binding protein [Thermaceae bacterium]
MSLASKPHLSLHNLSVYYDTVRAIEGVGLKANRGEIIALIGSNGAGKTTTLRAITGLVKPTFGEIWYEDQRINGLPPHRIAELGIRMVPEGRRIFPLMSVHDNLLMGAFLRRNQAEIRQDIERICARFPRLAERMKQAAGTLSGGEQQMVAMSRALMARPKLLLLDEPSLGLAPMVVREIARAIQAVNREDGVTVVLVEQNSRMALRLSSQAYVLETGKIALAGASAELQTNDRIRRLYLGISDESEPLTL